jgi:hypothetical protein
LVREEDEGLGKRTLKKLVREEDEGVVERGR